MHTDIDSLKDIVSRLDGLILTGGGDINPLYASEEPIPALQEMDAAQGPIRFYTRKISCGPKNSGVRHMPRTPNH